MVLDKVQFEKLKKEIKEELKKESQEGNSIKVLGRKDLQELFKCDRTKMNEIMNSIHKPPVVYIGRDYYITEKQMKEFFEGKYKNVGVGVHKNNNIKEEFNNENLRLLYKKDLMDMFKMGRTKFLQFINTKTLPIKEIGQEYYITENQLKEWFYKVQDTKIILK